MKLLLVYIMYRKGKRVRLESSGEKTKTSALRFVCLLLVNIANYDINKGADL